MNDKPKGPTLEKVILTNGVPIAKAFHDDLLPLVLARILELRYGEIYQTKDLVSPSYWASLDNADHWRIGCCIADWERTRKVPLRFEGCDLCKVRHYKRT